MNVGNPAENKVAQLGRELGYLISSRRHEGGAADQLWTPPADWNWTPPLLIEVKGTKDAPWRSTWNREKRQDLIRTARKYGCEPILAWVVPKLGIVWMPPADWPA